MFVIGSDQKSRGSDRVTKNWPVDISATYKHHCLCPSFCNEYYPNAGAGLRTVSRRLQAFVGRGGAPHRVIRRLLPGRNPRAQSLPTEQIHRRTDGHAVAVIRADRVDGDAARTAAESARESGGSASARRAHRRTGSRAGTERRAGELSLQRARQVPLGRPTSSHVQRQRRR